MQKSGMLGIVFCVLFLLVLLQVRSIEYGVRGYVHLGVLNFSIVLMLYLFVPIYGGFYSSTEEPEKQGF